MVHPQDIQDEGHLTISHDGRSCESGNGLELLAQGLDNDFFCVVDVIDDQAKVPVICLQNDNIDSIEFCHLAIEAGQEGSDLRREGFNPREFPLRASGISGGLKRNDLSNCPMKLLM